MGDRLDLTETSEAIEKRRIEKTEKLLRKEEKLKEGLDKQKTLREEGKIDEERSSHFIDIFNKALKEIEDKLKACDTESLERVELQVQFDEISKDCQKLAKYVADSKDVLPLALLEKYVISHKNLVQNIQTKKEEKLPSRKFAFKSRGKGKTSTLKGSESKLDRPSGEGTVSNTDKEEYNDQVYMLRDMDGVDITLTRREVEGKVVRLHNMKSSKVRIESSCNVLKLDSLHGCNISSGPVSSSVYVDRCDECDISVAAHQYRMHESRDCYVNLLVTSGGMIEGCKNIHFKSYNYTYPDINLDWRVARIDETVNHYREIKDFDWLVKDVASPNIIY